MSWTSRSEPTRLPRPAAHPRLSWIELSSPAGESDDGAEIARGLAAEPKELPCRLFYDERGSLLFEKICDLPEYYVTRTERALLAAVAPEIARLAGPATLVELGSGSAAKTRHLIDAYRRPMGELRYIAIDVSAASLQEAAENLLARYPELRFGAVVGRYEEGLAALSREEDAARLVLFLGSTIGNFTPPEAARFFDRLRSTLRPGDRFLLGTDLDKEPALIEAAYNDAQGVTADFNLNILRHINRRFRGDFALDRFRHRAFYDRGKRQIEMHLESRVEQEVQLAALGLRVRFAEGERIRTEISRKFDLAALAVQLPRHGFVLERSWKDAKAWFGLSLFRAA